MGETHLWRRPGAAGARAARQAAKGAASEQASALVRAGPCPTAGRAVTCRQQCCTSGADEAWTRMTVEMPNSDTCRPWL